MECPRCGTDDPDVYVGLNKVECVSPQCPAYVKPKRKWYQPGDGPVEIRFLPLPDGKVGRGAQIFLDPKPIPATKDNSVTELKKAWEKMQKADNSVWKKPIIKEAEDE